MKEETVLELIGDIYAAAERPALWPVFLDRLSEALTSRVTVLMHHDSRNRSASIASAVRHDPATVQVYEDYYAAKNVFFTAAPGPLVSGRLLSDTDIDERTLLRSEYYCDFLRPQDIRHSTGLIVLNEGGALSVLSTMRSKKKGPFTDPEFALLRALRPHIQRGFQLHSVLSRAEERATFHEAALDLVSTAVVILGASGHIAFMNNRAGELLGFRDGLSTQGGELLAADPAARLKLRSLIASAMRNVCEGGTGSGGAMIVERPSGKQPFQLVVSPLRARGATGGRGRVAIVIHQPEPPALDHSRLEELFGFTPAESRLALRLANGDRLSEVAATLGLSVETVRSQLKRVFAKTGTRRQVDLITRLHSVSPVKPVPRH